MPTTKKILILPGDGIGPEAMRPLTLPLPPLGGRGVGEGGRAASTVYLDTV